MSVKSKFDPSLLHVVTCISNPVRYSSRYALYNRFATEMKACNANLFTVEAAFGNRSHEITPPIHGNHLQVRINDELWHKENLLNLGIQRLPSDWQYCCWVDSDISFLNPFWQEETIEALQHFSVVQMFQTAADLGPTGAVMNTYTGFAESFIKGIPYGPGAGGSYGPYWHSGFVWGIRREAFEELGGLIDFAIVGAGDHHMALSLIGRAEKSLPLGINPNYKAMVMEWQERAKASHIVNNIGSVPGTIAHGFHGSKNHRKYVERWDILIKNDFDPLTDIKRDSQGLWQLTKKGYRMKNQLRNYFRQRNEDSINE